MTRSSAHRRGWTILLETDAWQIVSPGAEDAPLERVTFPSEQLAAQAGPIQEALLAAGWRSEPILLGLSAASCLAATVDVPAPAMLRKPQSMRYHLEAWIPWSAEEFVADYVAHKTAAFMVALRIADLKPLLVGLEERDASPIAVLPTALLGLERHLANEDLPSNYLLLWRHDGETEFFTVRDGRPLAWRHAVGAASEDLLQLCAAGALQEGESTPYYVLGLSSCQSGALADAGITVINQPDLDWIAAIRETATLIAAGDAESPINLRRDELAGQRPTNAVAPQLCRLKVAAALAFLAVCTALWIYGDQYKESAGAARQRLTGVYEATFPAEPVPERIVSTMRKAQTLLQGTRGPVKELAVGPSSDLVLEKTIASLPTDLRYRVPEIRIEAASVHIAGEVRSNADADRIAAALRLGGFDVDAPRLQRLAEEGFSVRLAAQWTAPVQKETVK
jgi:hypothetical protein